VEATGVIAYKCLGSGRTARFSGFAWPAGGADAPWVEAAPSLCATGIHACRVGDLPYWLDAELWRIELGGEIVEGTRKVVAARGRLLDRVEAWDGEAAVAFGRSCAERAGELAAGSAALEAYAADVRGLAEHGMAAGAGFVTARLAELARGTGAYDAERAAQTAWLAGRLGLSD
jgi:hypothetical protein